MPIFSLPSPFGIGTLGRSAYEFVDFLKKSGQSYWQILPICPTSFGDSPYQSFSTLAGNPYFIDFELLEMEEYLSAEDFEGITWGRYQNRIDYGTLYKNRGTVFLRLYNNFIKDIPPAFYDFCTKEAQWLDDYALFMALKENFGGISFDKWDKCFSNRDKDALEKFKLENQNKIIYHKMLQFFFYKQWYQLKEYANNNGIKIIGDIPIYVSLDSADVWANPDAFMLDNELKPIEVAGCPPDAFTENGQLWGNPIYDWEYLKSTGYKWWIERLKASLEIYDVIRVDHFRAFESYYCVNANAKNAKIGTWRKGAGMDFWSEAERQLGDLPIIAEDLGFLTDDVRKLLDECGFAGMKVLQFAFDSREESNYLPHNYTKNSVVYTGTHDNDTILGWLETADADDVDYAVKYLRAGDKYNLPREMMLCAVSSVSKLCILTVQDLLGIGSDARINTPSTIGKNWLWRATYEQMKSLSAEKLLYYTRLYCR
ncbi:MAG: 4-alpha-glucanotransferase [Eubacterium sp.]